MTFLRILFQIIVGALFGVASGMALSPLLAALSGSNGTTGFLIVFVVVGLLVSFAPTVRRAFGRGFLALGASVFALPLSTFILSGVVTNEMVDQAADADKGMTAAGSVIAGGMMTGVAGLFGFIVGSVLLLAGLILSLGGRREVVLVEQPNNREPRLPR